MGYVTQSVDTIYIENIVAKPSANSSYSIELY